MNLKSLLIGSAAALVAAPAFAADVIIAEPEPVEYVEVCDVAGAGYFYIPGSRTCLQISGLVRHQLDFRGDRDATIIRSNLANRTVIGGQVIGGQNVTAAQNGVFVNRANGATGVFGPGTANPTLPAGAVAVAQPVAGSTVAGVTTLQGAATQDGIRSLVRGEVNVRTFTETELGDLTSFIRFRGNDRNQDPLSVVVTQDGNSFNTEVQNVSDNGSVLLNNAVIGLGGLSLGLSDSLYDGGIAGEFDSFGGDRVHFIRYTADLGAFSASISAEAERESNSQNNYVPNIVGKLSGDIGAFSVNLFAGYDDGDGAGLRGAAGAAGTAGTGLLLANTTRRAFFLDDEDSFSVKATASFDIGIFGVAAGATYNESNNNFDNGYEYSVAGSGTVGLGEKASITFGGQYFFNALADAEVARNVIVNGNTVDVLLRDRSIDAIDAYSIGAHVDYEIVDGFDVKVAVNYKDIVVDDGAFAVGATPATGIRTVDSDGAFEGFIRFDRSF